MSVGGLCHSIGFIPGPCFFNHEIAAIFKGNNARRVGGLRAVQGSFQASDLGLEVSWVSAVLAPLDKEGELFPTRLRPNGAEIAQGSGISSGERRGTDRPGGAVNPSPCGPSCGSTPKPDRGVVRNL